MRIVYDASAKARKGDKSLNDCLYRGSVTLPSLYGLLIRFRISPIGIVGDLEKAFLNVGLQTHDRDVTRFLWLKDLAKSDLENNLQVYHFCLVPFGVISSRFGLVRSGASTVENICVVTLTPGGTIPGALTIKVGTSVMLLVA